MYTSKIIIDLKENIEAPPLFNSSDGGLSNEVAALRKKLELTQQQFADRFGFPISTIRNWEQKNAKPDSAARIVIAMIKEDPEQAARLAQSVKEKI